MERRLTTSRKRFSLELCNVDVCDFRHLSDPAALQGYFNVFLRKKRLLPVVCVTCIRV